MVDQSYSKLLPPCDVIDFNKTYKGGKLFILKLFGPVRQYMGFYMKHCLVGPLLNY